MSQIEPRLSGRSRVEQIQALIGRTTAAIVESHARIERAKALADSTRRSLPALQPLFASRGRTAPTFMTLHRLSARFLRHHDVQMLLDDALNAALAATRTDRGNVQMVDPVTRSLRIVAQRGFDEEFLEFFASVRTEGSCGKAARLRQQVIVADVTTHPIFASRPALEVMLRAGALAAQSTPIVTSSGTVLGVISTHFPTPHRPLDAELQTVQAFARNVGTLIAPSQ